jgi:site-specific recombinase XerD
MIKDMGLAGYTGKTQTNYISAVTALQAHYGIRPDRLPEKQVYEYVVWMRDEKGVAKGTFQTHFYGLKFFYYRCLGYDWALFTKKKVRQPKQKRLPIALSGDDCRKLIVAVRKPGCRLCLSLMYALGLRIEEAVALPVNAIDSERMTMRIIGKGNKERLAPLPKSLLIELRKFWKTHRHQTWLFPNRNGNAPLTCKALRQAFDKARDSIGLDKKFTPHCLRHGFATHLMECGVDTRIAQILLGHASIRSTQIYTHLTEAARDDLRERLGDMFDDIFPGGRDNEE